MNDLHKLLPTGIRIEQDEKVEGDAPDWAISPFLKSWGLSQHWVIGYSGNPAQRMHTKGEQSFNTMVAPTTVHFRINGSCLVLFGDPG